MNHKYLLTIKNFFSSQETFQVVLSFFLLVWIIFIGTPFDIVASNAEEFTLTTGSSILWNGLFYSALAFLGLAISYTVISLLFKSNFRKFVLFIIITLSVSAWCNSTLLTGVYGEFDGRGNLQIDPFSPLTWIQIGVFLGVFLFTVYYRSKPKVITYTLASICFIALLTSTVNISSKLSESTVSQGNEDSFFTYSKSNPNLLIILLDEYESGYFSEILDNEMKNSLDGFIWFKDIAANFPTTIAALPAIFSGEIYDNNTDIKDFYNKVSPDSFANKLSDQGFQVSFTQSSPMSEILFPDQSLVTLNSLDPEYITTYNDLVNYSIFRIVPDLIKLNIYNDGKWLIHIKKETPYDALGGIGASFKNLNLFANRELIVTDGPSTLKFHHSVVTHSPTVLGSNCEAVGVVPSTLQNKSAEGKCAMSKVIQIVNNLKKAGVFDNTMIVVTADHGSVYTPESFHSQKPYSKASPTLLIKPLGSRHPFQISDAPAQLSDLPKTIAVAFDMSNASYPGIDLLTNNAPTNRTRLFNNYNWTKEYFNWSKSRVPPITKYKITGPLDNATSWKTLKNISPFACHSTLTFYGDASPNYMDNLSIREPWGRWSDGDLVEIEFQTEANCQAKSVTFNLNAFVTPKNPEQTAHVFINDRPAGDIRIAVGETQPKSFTFALPDAQDNRYTIRFEIDKPTTPKSVGVNEDGRKLGFGFISMTLSPNEVMAP